MGESNNSFIQRLTAAFVSASAVFLAILGVVALPRLFQETVGYIAIFSAAANALDTVGGSLAIIIVVIFVIAYPVERWLVKPTTAAWMASLIYVGVFAVLTFISACFIPLSHYPEMWAIVFAIGCAVAGVVAAFARLLYPLVSRAPKTTRVIALVLLFAGLLGPVIPYQPSNAPVGVGIFPGLVQGELGRGTMMLDARGVYASGYYDPAANIDPAKKYELSFTCLKPRKPFVFQAEIRNGIIGNQFLKHDFTCESTAVQHFQVEFGKRHFDPWVGLWAVTQSGGHWAPDAWVILAPVGVIK
jgi:hypothetical protein